MSLALPPVVQELSPAPDPFSALNQFLDSPGLLLLESTRRESRLGRYSFLMADPVDWFEREAVAYGDEPFAEIATRLAEWSTTPVPGLPPFQGGAAGLLGYELGRAFERLPSPPALEPALPVLAVGLYLWVIAWDHGQDRAWLIAHRDDQVSAEARAADVRARLSRPPLDPSPLRPAASDNRRETFPHSGPGRTRSTFSREAYCAAVAQIVERIRAGDLFQANLAQQLALPVTEAPSAVYGRLRRANPAPFSGFFAHEDWAIASSSPERFLRLEDGRVAARPIKGTRPRSLDREDDRHQRRELAASEKDRAENVMIVDLLRNDLSRVCRPGTVRADELCAVESYETVHHLVSTVSGRLEAGRSVWDLLAAAFPGGSITGAPKIRAMETIADMEPIPRGPYCGSFFSVGLDGRCDSSILIRTIAMRNQLARIGIGGGVTSLSDPEAEYQETLDKAAGMLRSFPGSGAG